MWLMSFSSKLSRLSFRKSFILIVLCITVLIMSWESQKVDAALLQTAIPDESIRLRILAHSDSPKDQAIKMIVRDRIVEKMNSWATDASSIEDARVIVEQHIDELKQAVADVLAENGQTYSYTVALTDVEFPTKSYGTIVYPGGLYEALLITLGNADGRNWWCVLFPPLCFVDTMSGEATTLAKVDDEQTEQVAQPESIDTVAAEQSKNVSTEADVEVKFFVAEVWNWFKNLFA